MIDDYPGIEAAYPIAIASYDVAIKRLDAIDGRLQTMMAFAITATALVMSSTVNKGFKFHSCFLYLAAGCFVAGVSVGTYARLHGNICLLEPEKLYQRWLHKSDATFKKDLIYFAGEHFHKNMELVARKWNLSLLAIALFALEMVFLAAWVVARYP